MDDICLRKHLEPQKQPGIAVNQIKCIVLDPLAQGPGATGSRDTW